VIANDFSKRKRKSLIIRIFLEMLLTDWRGKKRKGRSEGIRKGSITH
jgi:hypothetical protein